MPLSSGQVLQNRYRIVKLIGQGGFGAVYRAWDTTLNQPCAVKENLDTSPEAQRQFQREASILAGLRHPNLPRVTDHFFSPGQGQYLVMDYVEGSSLDDILKQKGRPLTEQESLPWIEQVCDALDYLHRQSPPVIHRDLKPQNVIVTPDGRAMLVDFGISKVYDPQLSTTTGAQAVTPGYSPPEQYGQGRTDPRSDVYALGATCYALLTGGPPPDALDRLVHGVPLPSPRQANPRLSATVERAILGALEVTTARRFQSVGQFHGALVASAVSSGAAVPAPSRPAPAVLPAPPRRTLPIGPIVAAVLVLAFLACAGGVLLILLGPMFGPVVALTPTSAPQVKVVPTVAYRSGEQPTPEAIITPTKSGVARGEEETKLDLRSSISGVQNLSSYRVGFRFDWKGTKAGQPVDGYIDMRSAFVREPAAREMQFEAKGMDQASAQTPSKISFIQVGDTAWMYESQSNTWIQVPAGESSLTEAFFKPEDLVSSFDVSKGQRSSLPEEVNGVSCYKYTFTEKDFTSSAGETVKNASGEAYIAVDGGYVVKMTINGDVSYTKSDQMFDEGTIKLAFDLTDINKPITIEPPAEAKAQTGGRADLPKMPDAKVELSTSELISYRTASSVKDTANFYETEMVKNGWTAAQNNKDLIMSDSAILSYTKGGETCNIIVNKDDKGTGVMISIAKGG